MTDAIKEKNKICLLAPTKVLAETAKNIIARENLPISVYIGALDTAVSIAKELQEQGAWLFISRKGTKAALENRLGVKTVSIALDVSDYIPVITQARKEKGVIAVFYYDDISSELETICYLLNIKIKCYKFTTNEEAECVVKQAVKDRVKLAIGGSVTDFYAKQYNLKHIIVESSQSSIEDAIHTAYSMLLLHIEDAKKQEALEIRLERYKNIFNYTHDAIIAVDNNGYVEIANKVARKMLSSKEQSYTGKYIDKVLPNTRLINILRSGEAEIDQLMDIKGTLVSTNRIPIIVNKKIKGAVATFQDVETLQTAEQNIRIKLHEKGLAAKYNFSDIIGNSPQIAQAKYLAATYADSEFTVMLYGETGTGKELFAQSIHNASPRKDGPFVAINCTSLSKTLLEAELFGYADSSFTGAKKGGKPGLFELAHRGTIFLDEIGELPIEIQAQFLRVLQEKEVRRVGGDKMVPVDIRVIGATNKNLQQCVEREEFRKDLFYRLNVLNLVLPPLRDREDDYLLIAKYLYNGIAGHKNEDVVMRILRDYHNYGWPGNIRELTNVVERISLLVGRNMDEKLILSVLKTMVPVGRTKQGTDKDFRPIDKSESLADAERNKIEEELAANKGNISLTARKLDISRATLYRKLKK